MNLSELKKLHDKGFAIIYLHEKSKRPLESGWTTTNKKSWDELENSFEKKYNAGVRLGSPSCLSVGTFLGVIDCDVKAQTREAKLEMNEALRTLGIDLAQAPIVISGRGNGSKHVYVQTTKPIQPMKYAQSQILVKTQMPSSKPSTRDIEKLSKIELAEGYRMRPAWEIAFMGEGQQVVLPGSTHPDTGFEYKWASPFTMKTVPLFDPNLFVSQTTKKLEERELDFKATDVDLYKTNLPVYMINQIETGENCEDRSATLLSVSMSMCRFGLGDNQILSVLSDPKNWISGAAYEHTGSNSRARAVRWLHKYTLTKARYETDIMRRFENKPVRAPLTPKEVEEVEEELTEDKNKILHDLDGKGKPRPTLRNMVQIMEHFFDGGLIGLDEFSNQVTFLKDTPYGAKKGKELADHHDLDLKHYIASHYRFEPSKELCYETHAFISNKYRYNSVRDYLDGLKWDGVERLDTWLKTAFDAIGPEDYVRAVSRKVLTAAVARIYEPGCKFDYMMVLEGFQGKGKSKAIQNIVGKKWFSDSLGDIKNKDVVGTMTGKWVVEVAELSALKNSDVESTKSFITREVDRVRPSYGRHTVDFPRQTIFIGTTNDREYLKDETGNRRFWPIEIKGIHADWVLKNRDQLLAEAVVRYELGEDLYFTPEIEDVARGEQSQRYQTDEWEHVIKSMVEENPTKVFTSTMIIQKIYGDITQQPNDQESKRIGKVMRRLGYKRQAVRSGKDVFKGWVKDE